MKWNKTAFILASVGVAAAAAAYFLTTEHGRKFTRNLRRRGEEMLQDVGEISKQAKEKFRGIEGVLNSFCTEEKSKAAAVNEAANS